MNNFIQNNASRLDWLLETTEPGAAYLATRDLLDLPQDDPGLLRLRDKAHRSGPIAQVLSSMTDTGYWVEPGPGYLPKYFSTVWSLILLAQLGADIQQDERIERACTYYLDQACSPGGIISASETPSGTADCLQGNMCWALTRLGFQDERLDVAYEWMARSVTGEGVAPMGQRDTERRYYGGNSGPLFACGANDRQSCAWGGTKVMLAFAALPPEKRTPLIERAIQTGVDYMFRINPVTGEYPHPYSPKPSGNWWKFGFPVFYITDLLQLAEGLVGLGYANDPRLADVHQLIREKQDSSGRWLLENGYQGKITLDFGEKKAPSKWVTIRALRVLKAVDN